MPTETLQDSVSKAKTLVECIDSFEGEGLENVKEEFSTELKQSVDTTEEKANSVKRTLLDWYNMYDEARGGVKNIKDDVENVLCKAGKSRILSSLFTKKLKNRKVWQLPTRLEDILKISLQRKEENGTLGVTGCLQSLKIG